MLVIYVKLQVVTEWLSFIFRINRNKTCSDRMEQYKYFCNVRERKELSRVMLALLMRKEKETAIVICYNIRVIKFHFMCW